MSFYNIYIYIYIYIYYNKFEFLIQFPKNQIYMKYFEDIFRDTSKLSTFHVCSMIIIYVKFKN